MRILKDNELKECFSYIRFSSKAQGKEDKTSEDRQLQIAPRIAEQFGWNFREDLCYEDLGISSFKGRNIKEGDLGLLLQAVKENKLPSHSVCIIEAFDRLTRLPPLEALRIIEQLLSSGLELYVDRNSKLYTVKSLTNLTDLLIILLETHGSNEYSAKLGGRVKAANTIKKERYKEDGGTYRVRCPSWLKWNKDTKTYDILKDKVEILKKVFELTADGHGRRSVVKYMLKHGYPALSGQKNPRWNVSLIRLLIDGKSALGYSKGVDGEQRKIYPAVISEELYYKALNKMNERKVRKFYGRTGQVHNLFGGVAECVCGHSMAYRAGNVRKGTNWKGLWCHGCIAGVCNAPQVSYNQVENSFIAWTQVENSTSASLFRKEFSDSKEEHKEPCKYEVLQGKLTELQRNIESYTVDYQESPSKALAGLLSKLETQQEALVKEMEEEKAIQLGSTEIEMVIQRFGNSFSEEWQKNKDSSEFRFKVRELIRSVIEKIVVNAKERFYTIYFKNKELEPVKVEYLRKACIIDAKTIFYNEEPDIRKNGLRVVEVRELQEA